MARSSYIYIALDADGKVLFANTVKYEFENKIEDCERAIESIVRVGDNVMGAPVELSYDDKEGKVL